MSCILRLVHDIDADADAGIGFILFQSQRQLQYCEPGFSIYKLMNAIRPDSPPTLLVRHFLVVSSLIHSVRPLSGCQTCTYTVV